MSVDVTPLQNDYLHCAYCSREAFPDLCRHCQHYPYFKRTRASHSTNGFPKGTVFISAARGKWLVGKVTPEGRIKLKERES